jgi:hypothetical protein
MQAGDRVFAELAHLLSRADAVLHTAVAIADSAAEAACSMGDHACSANLAGALEVDSTSSPAVAVRSALVTRTVAICSAAYGDYPLHYQDERDAASKEQHAQCEASCAHHGSKAFLEGYQIGETVVPSPTKEAR